MAVRRGTRYICRPCGLEVVVSSAGAGVGQLVCCERTMEARPAKKKAAKKKGKRK